MRKKYLGLFLLLMIGSLSLTGCSKKPYILDDKPTMAENTIDDLGKDEEPQESSNTFAEARVVRVVDGDTIVATVDGVDEKIRFVLVNTPETKHPKKGVEYYGKEASDFTKVNLEDKTIYLEKDVSDRDRYGRMLRYIWLKRPATNNPTDEEIEQYMFNAILLKKGFANLSTFPPDIKYVDLFVKLERDARKNNLGLWGDDGEPVGDKSSSKEETVSRGNPEDPIRANVKSKIYHVPGGKNYDKVSKANIIYFKTEEDAIAAGYRKAKN